MLVKRISGIAAVCATLFVGSVISAGSAASRQQIENLVKAKGKVLYYLAWQTAKYTGIEVESIQQSSGRADVVVLLRGKSALSGDEIWVRAGLKLEGDKFVDLEWREHSRVLVPPGSMLSDLATGLQWLNATAPDPAKAKAQEEEWKRFDARMKIKFDGFNRRQNRAAEQRVSSHLDDGRAFLTFQTSPGCHASVAIYFQALDGQWTTIAWLKAYYPEDEDYYTLKFRGSYVWLYAKSTKGTLHQIRGSSDENLERPVIMDRDFIREGEERLTGPSFEVVPFFRVYAREYGPGSNTYHFECSL
jgi:hypothetical protein